MAGRSSCRNCRNEQKGCCSGGLRRRRKNGSVPEGVDRLSALPDDLLLGILARLGCARAAAHACLLARRWRGLRARLPDLAFHAACPDTLDAALATAASRPSLSLLSIRCDSHHSIDSAWMRAAARLAPAKLVISHVSLRGSSGLEIELPCLDRATSITLDLFAARLVLPPEGEFPALETLSLRYCLVDLEDLLPRCSRLRKIQITAWYHELLKVHSPTLEELDVDVHLPSRLQIRHVDIVAPVLKKLSFDSGSRPWRWSGAKEFTLFYSAPMVKDLHWRCVCDSETDRFGVRWSLFSLTLRTAEHLGQMHFQPQHHPHVVHTLSMSIGLPFSVYGDEDKEFGQQISKIIPVTKFQVFQLRFETKRHVYGAMVLHLLGMCTFIRRLRMKLYQEDYTCSVKCPCDHPSNWRSQSVSLTNLKEVEIHGFLGRCHEVDLLKVLFRSATMLERIDVHFASMDSPSKDKREEIYGISNVHPSIKCNIYHGSTE